MKSYSYRAGVLRQMLIQEAPLAIARSLGLTPDQTCLMWDVCAGLLRHSDEMAEAYDLTLGDDEDASSGRII